MLFPGQKVTNPNGLGCGVDVSYFTGHCTGVVLGRTAEGNWRVGWQGEEIRHEEHELEVLKGQ